jgi:hypothetical protein
MNIPNNYSQLTLENHPEDVFVLSITRTAKGKQVAAVLAAQQGTWCDLEAERKHEDED